jgi:colanic acid/amylovoran biosynthesis glycosyltransferase
VDRYVELRGDVSDSELLRYYEEADMFILPCIITENGDRDGIPVAMMEAMAMGLPLISTIVSGVPELVEDGTSGILVPPKDEKAIADAIIALCKDTDLRVKMGKKGRKMIEREFNITIEAEKLHGIFENVAKQRVGKG